MTDKLDEFGRSALHYSSMEDDATSVRRLIEQGENVDLSDNNGYSPLHFAAQENAIDAARVLLHAGAGVDVRDKWGNTPLARAVMSSKGRGEMIALLRENNADPFAQNKYNNSPISTARRIANYNIRQFFADLP